MELSDSGALEAFNLCLGFVPCMVAKAACELGIPDILAAHHEPMSALHMAQLLRPQPSRPLPEAAQQLDRMMRCLCAYNVFKAHAPTAPDPSPTYSLTPVSHWLQRDAMQASLLLQMSPQCQDPWHRLSHSVLHGVAPFTAAHSMDVWALAAADPSFNRLYHSGSAAPARSTFLALLEHYDGLQDGVLTIVDVGGGSGIGASCIASRYPSLKAINFDLPSVIAMAPIYPGVQHIGGDMFQSIPPGDAIFMKGILQNWTDEDCIKILENCRKVLPSHGKLIILEVVLNFEPMEDCLFHTTRVTLDMLMLAHTTSGKERTKKEWKILFDAAKFSISKIIEIHAPYSIIEAIPLIDIP